MPRITPNWPHDFFLFSSIESRWWGQFDFWSMTRRASRRNLSNYKHYARTTQPRTKTFEFIITQCQKEILCQEPSSEVKSIQIRITETTSNDAGWYQTKSYKKNYSTQYSQVISHPSTNCANISLTSEIGRDPVYSNVYGRSWFQKDTARLWWYSSWWRHADYKKDSLHENFKLMFISIDSFKKK